MRVTPSRPPAYPFPRSPDRLQAARTIVASASRPLSSVSIKIAHKPAKNPPWLRPRGPRSIEAGYAFGAALRRSHPSILSVRPRQITAKLSRRDFTRGHFSRPLADCSQSEHRLLDASPTSLALGSSECSHRPV